MGIDNRNGFPGDVRDIQSPILELPQDPETVERLRRKLEEYKARYEAGKAQMKGDTFIAPEERKKRVADAWHKIAVLSHLLKEGRVNTHDLSRQLEREDEEGIYSPEHFDNACGVIEDYVTTGGENVRSSSTGF